MGEATISSSSTRSEPVDGAWPVPWQPVWGERNGLGELLSYFAAQTVIGGAARAPLWMSDLATAAAARVVKAFDRRRLHHTRDFLRLALGNLPPAEVDRRLLQAYRHLFRVMADARRFNMRIPVEETLEHFDVSLSDDARAVRDSGEGCVALTAHVGSWEAGVAALPWLGFHPVYAVARPPKNKRLSMALQEDRERRGVRVLPRRGAMRNAAKVIQAGGTIAMVLDQRARKRPVLAPFFGRPARCDRSAAVLMKRLRVPVVFGFCTLTEEPMKYRLELGEVLCPEELAGADPVEISTRINGVFERAILAHPEQYFWLHNRYKDTPEAFPDDREGKTLEPSPTG